MVRARKITDEMAITAAHSLADFAEKRGIHVEDIVPNMEEDSVFPHESADVAMQAIKDGVARIQLSRGEAFEIARRDIETSRNLTKLLMDKGYIEKPPLEMIKKSLDWAIAQVKR